MSTEETEQDKSVILKKNMSTMQKLSDLLDSSTTGVFIIETYGMISDMLNSEYDYFLEEKDNYESLIQIKVHLVNVEEILMPIFIGIQNNDTLPEDVKLSHVLLFYIITEYIFTGYVDEEVYAYPPNDSKEFKLKFAESLEIMLMNTWTTHPSDIDYFFTAYIQYHDGVSYHNVLEAIIMDDLTELYFEEIKSILKFKQVNYESADLVGWSNNSRYVTDEVYNLKNFDDVFKVLKNSNLLLFDRN